MDRKRTAIVAEIPHMRRYARALLRDRESADDLVQDSLERAFSRLENWRDGDNPRRWLFTIMHHLFIDHVRRDHRRRASAEVPIEAAHGVATPPAQLDGLQSREVLDALQAIAPERRAALVLVALEGLSYAEAANTLGIPTGTLMSRISRGREDLRARLDDTTRRRSIRVVDT
ncbi:MAG TPA: sigma-70 family RNA polymerase sigma factor [Rhizobiales bacterium]|nr:sigma-70 family RNA polymerase sigma factor [Hyphomicrobiales bacterium]